LYKLDFESNKQIYLILILIIVCSLSLKLYTIDFSVHEVQDTWLYALRGIANSNGDFAESPIKPPGYPLFLSLFFNFLDSENFIDYVNVGRILAIITSSAIIFPIYFLGKHFFDKKFALLLPLFFAFQPQLNFNAGQALSEPYFLIVLITSLYFLFNTNSKYSTYVSFILLGLLFWIRFSGLLFVAPFIISHFLIHRDLKKLVICCFLFLLIISPILVSRDEQYDNPLFFPISVGDEKEFKSIPDRFDPNWFQTSFGNLFYALGIMSVPFLIFLFPIGMLLSIKTSENKKNFASIWILLILTFIPMLIQYFIGTSARPLYHIYPFLMIFSIIPIVFFYKYKINFLNFAKKKKFLILLIIFLILSSILVTVGIDNLGYGKKDTLKIQEIHTYAKDILTLKGELFWSKGESISWVSLTMIEESDGNFKNYKIPKTLQRFHDGLEVYYPISLGEIYPNELNIHTKTNANTIDAFIANADDLNIKYLSVGPKNDISFFDDVYANEQDYPYLKIIFDSKKSGFEKYEVKLFEINYDIFSKFINNSR